VPKHAQTGSIVLQRSGLTVVGAWVPNWQYDVYCLEKSLADEVASRFNVQLLPVTWPKTPGGEAMQIVVPTVGEKWFDHDQLRGRTTARHGKAGARCATCGVCRWMPLSFGKLPPLQITPPLGDVDIAASPEWFGDGWHAFRQILFRRELAELIASASPRDFEIQPVS
jgi:hypothetical protein